jgi:hypothetical protein
MRRVLETFPSNRGLFCFTEILFNIVYMKASQYVGSLAFFRSTFKILLGYFSLLLLVTVNKDAFRIVRDAEYIAAKSNLPRLLKLWAISPCYVHRVDDDYNVFIYGSMLNLLGNLSTCVTRKNTIVYRKEGKRAILT